MRTASGDERQEVALVTGASRGIGRAIAVELARAGMFVLINYKSDERGAEQTRAEVRATGSNGAIVRADVGVEADVEAMFDLLEREYGGRIDVLVNNAGVTRDGLLTSMETEDWRGVMDVNVDGVYRCTKRALSLMLPSRYGRVVNISSIMAQRPNKGLANYAASKGAVDAFTRALATEVGYKGITVNAVAPGFIATDMMEEFDDVRGRDGRRFNLNAVRRPGTPEDVASLVGFLCSRKSAFVTGQVILVDGGVAAVGLA